MGTSTRRWAFSGVLVAAGVVAGVAGGYAASTTTPTLYRAETTLVVQQANQPLAGPGQAGLVRTVQNLLATDLLSQVVIRNLGLQETPADFARHLRVLSDPSAVLRVQIDDRDQARAQQIAQELGVVFSQLVQDRLATSAKPVQVVVFDPAHAVGKVSPRVGRDVGWGTLLGGLAGLLAANLFLLRRGRPEHVTGRRSPPLLADLASDDGFGSLAELLLASADRRPFQTVLVAGDPDERIAAGLADRLAERGESSSWVRAEDADPGELDRLAARSRFVVVSSSSFESPLAARVDVVVAVASSLVSAAAIDEPAGARLVGTVLAPTNGTS